MKSKIIYCLLLLLIRFTFSSITIIDSNNVNTRIRNNNNNINNKFPDDFLFGASTAAYQIEGGWNADGKGPSIWDQFTHEHPELIVDHSNADIGPDSYHFYEDDIKALKHCGLNFYRFSIAWSRILPNGDITSVNEMGLKYYHRLIDKLLENGIEPMITMYHYDLPQSLMNIGGLLNDVIIKYFEDYAMLLFNEYGNRVKCWITFNEPFDFCVDGFGGGSNGDTPPLLKPVLSGIGEYLCVDNVLKSHAIVYHLYKKKYSHFNGKIGISLSSRYFYDHRTPAQNDTINDIVDRAMQYQLGWLTHPLFIGDYPPIMIREIASSSLREGRFHSRLPIMTDEWKFRIKGALDFLGLNYYTSRLLVEFTDNPTDDDRLLRPSWLSDAKLNMTIDPKWIRAKSTWLYMVPKGFGDILRWLRDDYDNPEIIITENGWSDDGEQIDMGRIMYLREHLNELVKAINIDKCNVKAYTIWSIIDNFEWNRGYSEPFGLYSVNLNSTNKERTAKESAHFLKDIIQSRIVPSSVYKKTK